jgi:hypothetical protein
MLDARRVEWCGGELKGQEGVKNRHDWKRQTKTSAPPVKTASFERRVRAFNTQKTNAFAPIAQASVRTATMVN